MCGAAHKFNWGSYCFCLNVKANLWVRNKKLSRVVVRVIIAFWTFLTKGVSLDFLEEKLCGTHKFNWASNSQSLLCRSTDTTECHPFRVLARKIELLSLTVLYSLKVLLETTWNIYIYIYISIFSTIEKEKHLLPKERTSREGYKKLVSVTF